MGWIDTLVNALKESSFGGEKESQVKQITAVQSNKSMQSTNSARRLSHQCLIVNFDKLFDISRLFSNFSIIDKDLMIFSNILTSKRNINGFLNNIKPFQMAALVPRIRLFLVVSGKNREDVMIPIQFEDKGITEENIQSIMDGGIGKPQGAGIKSVNFEYHGTNFAETDKFIKCKIQYFFSDMSTIFKEHPLSSDIKEKYGKPVMQYADLVYYGNTLGKDDKSTTENFPNRLKLHIGWANPGVDVLNNLFIGQGFTEAEVMEFFSKSSVELDLQLVTHNISYEQDGSIKIDADYHAYFDSVMSRKESNLLLASDEDIAKMDEEQNFEFLLEIKEAALETKKYLEDNKKSDNGIKDIKDVIVGGAGFSDVIFKFKDLIALSGRTLQTDPILSGTTAFSDFINSFKGEGEYAEYSSVKFLEPVDKYIAIIESLLTVYRKKYRTKVYSAFIGRLLDQNKIWLLKVDKDMYESLMDNNQINKDSARRIINNIQSKFKDGNADYWGRIDEFYDPQVDVRSETSEEAKISEDFITDYRVDEESTKIQIPFIYLGDLIDAALEQFYFNNGDSDFQRMKTHFFLAPFVYESPITGEKIETNLAYIPVTLSILEQWLYEVLLKPELTVWSLKDFLSSIITKLMEPLMGAGCWQEKPIGNQVDVCIDMIPISTGDGNDPLAIRNDSFDNKIVGRSLIESKNMKFDLNPSESQPGWTYIVIYVVNKIKWNSDATILTGDQEQNIANGIYHFEIGKDRGLVKNIKFRKTNLAGLAEARVERSHWLDHYQLRDVYDADVTLYGMPVFRNGQYCFIDPTTMGVPIWDVARLGIGGYFLIINVKNGVSIDNKFETILTLKWQDFGTKVWDKFKDLDQKGLLKSFGVTPK